MITRKFSTTVVFLFIFISLFSIEKSDSLRAVIHSHKTSDKDKLLAFEDLSIYLQNTDFELCRELCKEGITFSRSIKNHVYESSFNTRIGTTWFYSGDYDSTAFYWINALEISENAKDTARIMSCLNNLGVLNTFTKDYDKSLEYYLRSLHYKKLSGNREAIAITEMNIGINYLYMGNLDSAQIILFRVFPVITSSKNNRAKAILYNNLGSVFIGLEEFEKALHYYSLTEEYDNLLLINDKAILLQNKGICYYNLKQEDKAIESMQAALELARLHDMKVLKKSIYENLASFYYSSNNYKTAYDYLLQYGSIKDSVLNMDKDKAIKDIQAKYESEKKDKELIRKSEEVLRNQRIIWMLIIIIAIVLLSTIIIIFMLKKLQKANNKLNSTNQKLDTLNHELIKAKGETELAFEFKSQFLANMSHEIRTPLNIIIGFNSILKKSISDPKLKDFIESIEISSYNLLQFLNDILDMSKIEAGKMILSTDKINLKKLIDDLTRLFILKAEEKGISLITEYDTNIPDEVLLDEVRLRQILFNLIGNAIKFTESGYVKLRVINATNNNLARKISSEIDLTFEVIDSGIGIPVEQHSLIFESFRQVKQNKMNQFGGSGLGLSISKRLSEIMEGTLSVESAPGNGSIFTLQLRKIPIIRSLHKDEKFIDLTDSSDFIFTGGTILVADDELLNRNLIKACFDKSVVRVFEAENGNDAIILARKVKPSVILMDMKMPVMDGFEAAQKIKEDDELKDIPIFAFSASSLFIEKGEIEKRLFSGYIPKPVALNELYYEIARFLPHNKKGTETASIRGNSTTFEKTDEPINTIPSQLFQIIENNFFPLWADVSESNAMNKIISFAEKLKEFALENGIKILLDYSEQILIACNSFDIVTIKKLLGKYPEIVKSFKTY